VRNAMVIAIAGACLAVDRPSRSIRLALGSVAPTIVRASDAEAFGSTNVDWEREAVDDPTAHEFGRLAAAASRPIDDHRASAAYRRHAVEVLARRLLRRAFSGRSV
jgi:CO/xanthine dehydrogenase FAD-binding subunit